MIGKNFVFQQMKQGINMHEVIPQNRVVDQLRKKKIFSEKNKPECNEDPKSFFTDRTRDDKNF
ncbi:hypothetical protein [Paenibacillus sp. FSL E2-0190]|uniref:hypothetical protein n=1 Tax=Paenibacillus sp. FSL E2-0190 TaxID=2954504 RepID=UPI0030ED2E4E